MTPIDFQTLFQKHATTRQGPKQTRLLVLAALGMACSFEIASAATLDVYLGGGGICGDALAQPQSQTFDAPGGGEVSASGANNTGCSGQAMARAGEGYLSVYSEAEMLAVDPSDPALRDHPYRFINGRDNTTRASAKDYISFIPTRTDGSLNADELFQISANIVFTAQTFASFNVFEDGVLSFPGASGTVNAMLSIGQWVEGAPRNRFNIATLTSAHAMSHSAVGPEDLGTGGFAEEDYVTTLSTPPLWIRPGQELVLETQLSSLSIIRGSRETIGAAIGDSTNTLAFSTVGPVFNLPDGYTVNIPEWNIVDNRWIDPRDAGSNPSVSTVPLPAGFPLLLAGLAALGVLLHRRAGTVG